MKRRTLLKAFIVLALAVGVPSAFAAQGGNGNGNGGGSGDGGGTASLAASPNPAAPNGTRVYLTGCGYEFKVARVKISHSAGYVEEFDWGMASTGCLVSGYFVTREAGTYSVDVHQAQRNSRKPYVLKASTTLTVG
jgi:hypothetical protein